VFRAGGKGLRLYLIPEEPGSNELFLIFRDQTSARETYCTGHFLYAARPPKGQVMLDFT
jgi:uncharacterized protein (DUF1684 family)